MLGSSGSIASGPEIPKRKPDGLNAPISPDCNARQLAPPSVLINTSARPESPPPSLHAAYSVFGFRGSITRQTTKRESGGFRGKGAVTPQLVPPSVLFYRAA